MIKQIIEEIKEYAHDFRDIEMSQEDLQKMLTNLADEILDKQGKEFKKVVEEKDIKDLKFLKEMYQCSQKLLNTNYDAIILQHLDKMIEDWKDELEKQ